jgi:hypothetical protein
MVSLLYNQTDMTVHTHTHTPKTHTLKVQYRKLLSSSLVENEGSFSLQLFVPADRHVGRDIMIEFPDRKMQNNFIFSESPRMTPEPNQPRICRAPSALFVGV